MTSRITQIASLPGFLSVDAAAGAGRVGLFLAVLMCSSCANVQVRPQAHHEVLFCQGPTVETGNCSSADIRALERALFGLPGQRR